MEFRCCATSFFYFSSNWRRRRNVDSNLFVYQMKLLQMKCMHTQVVAISRLVCLVLWRDLIVIAINLHMCKVWLVINTYMFHFFFFATHEYKVYRDTRGNKFDYETHIQWLNWFAWVNIIIYLWLQRINNILRNLIWRLAITLLLDRMTIDHHPGN